MCLAEKELHMPDAAPKAPEAGGTSSGARWAFVVTATIIALACPLRKPLGLADLRYAHPMAIFMYGLLGLVFLNMVAFVVTLFCAFRLAKDVAARPVSDEQKERDVEGILVPAMQGQLPPPPLIWRIIRYPLALCCGLMAGAVLGWIIATITGQM